MCLNKRVTAGKTAPNPKLLERQVVASNRCCFMDSPGLLYAGWAALNSPGLPSDWYRANP